MFLDLRAIFFHITYTKWLSDFSAKIYLATASPFTHIKIKYTAVYSSKPDATCKDGPRSEGQATTTKNINKKKLSTQISFQNEKHKQIEKTKFLSSRLSFRILNKTHTHTHTHTQIHTHTHTHTQKRFSNCLCDFVKPWLTIPTFLVLFSFLFF